MSKAALYGNRVLEVCFTYLKLGLKARNLATKKKKLSCKKSYLTSAMSALLETNCKIHAVKLKRSRI